MVVGWVESIQVEGTTLAKQCAPPKYESAGYRSATSCPLPNRKFSLKFLSSPDEGPPVCRTYSVFTTSPLAQLFFRGSYLGQHAWICIHLGVGIGGSLCSIELAPKVCQMLFLVAYVSSPLLCMPSCNIHDLLARVSRFRPAVYLRAGELLFQAQLVGPERQDNQRVSVMLRTPHTKNRWRLDGGEMFGARKVVSPRITLVEAAPRASRAGRSYGVASNGGDVVVVPY